MEWKMNYSYFPRGNNSLVTKTEGSTVTQILLFT
jgi:hypothetical protein